MVHNYGSSSQTITPLAKAIAAKFSALPQVVAVALAGSRTSEVSDNHQTMIFMCTFGKRFR
jgi:hypothetical protein